MSAKITISFCVPAGYQPGDYAMLFGMGSYDSPLLGGRKFELFPNGAGIYGFGHAPFGHHRFGKGTSLRASGFGFGHLPFGKHPFGHATALVTTSVTVDACGSCDLSFIVYDKLGNRQRGSMAMSLTEVHTAPPAPTGLKKVSYDPDTKVLVLEAA